MKALIIAAALFVGIQAVTYHDLVEDQWTTFKLTHRKQYENSAEDRFRMKVFMDNVHKIEVHNQKHELGLVSYKLAVNKYADMLRHEIVNTLNGFNRTGVNRSPDKYGYEGLTYIPPANVKLPQSVDWRTMGAVTPVKDQGHCGSCWSFSATGSLEGQHFRQTGKLVSLSEQNLIDCSGKYGNSGCDGGLMDFAYAYIKDNRGLDTEKSYPYEAKNDTCRYDARNSGATDRGYVDIETGNEDQLQSAVATVGPISIAIDAGQESFHFYSNGVYDEPNCDSVMPNHGVLAVGYGTTEGGVAYWIVKNSWGTNWGDEGYILMSRNKKNQCGIATQASYPLV